MAKKLKEMEVQWRKEKEEASEAFQQERKVNLTILQKSIAILPYLIYSRKRDTNQCLL